ncbi:hypothetical protein HYU09_00750 [Candidatus Woesearchaeota archaeon]|nr:hypothetical protein [Candidatus Woesearchaeota archaeon]
MAVIKIDDKLLKEVKRFIREDDNRFDYPTIKSFVDKAVYVYLKKRQEK